MSQSEGQLQSFTIDQAAGAFALAAGAIGSLLLVVWQSRCKCRCRIGLSDSCYIFDCAREPPSTEEEEEKEDKDPKKKKEVKKLPPKNMEQLQFQEETTLDIIPQPEPQTQPQPEPEPEPQMEP